MRGNPKMAGCRRPGFSHELTWMLSLSAVFVLACGRESSLDDPDAADGGGYTGGPAIVPECKADVPDTVAAFVPSSAPVHCTDAAAFSMEGRQVRLTHVKYAALLPAFATRL